MAAENRLTVMQTLHALGAGFTLRLRFARDTLGALVGIVGQAKAA